MEKNREICAVFAIGAAGYPMLELLWRSRTHWTMIVIGGVCFLVLYLLYTDGKKRKRWKQCALGAAAVTAVEFAAGCVVNLSMGWEVWDYSGVPGNVLGQICPLYSLLWALLCLPVMSLCEMLRGRLRRGVKTGQAFARR